MAGWAGTMTVNTPGLLRRDVRLARLPVRRWSEAGKGAGPTADRAGTASARAEGIHVTQKEGALPLGVRKMRSGRWRQAAREGRRDRG